MEDHPRQCIIVGSTNNNDGFLRDITGNRRFWPIVCTDNGKHRPWEVESSVPQLWAEAYLLYQQGETLYLSPEVERLAEQEQTAALEADRASERKSSRPPPFMMRTSALSTTFISLTVRV